MSQTLNLRFRSAAVRGPERVGLVHCAWLSLLLFGSAAIAQQTQPIRGISELACGDDHTCVIDQAGRLRCAGANTFGQLGDNSSQNRPLPVDVALPGVAVLAVAAGGSHTCAIITGGALKCWGLNGNGQLGDGSFNDSAAPVDVQGLTAGVQSVSAGAFHTCAVNAGGAALCWGFNNRGQLGNGTSTNSNVPVNVQGLSSGMSSVSAGYRFSCGLSAGGAVSCWGEGGSGELGNGMTANSSTPVAVQGLSSGVSAITTGGFHACALLSGGMKCWGFNDWGQLGDGTNGTDRSTPVDVQGLSAGVSAMSAASGTFNTDHTCAVTSAGAVKCWGRNLQGQLGDDSFTSRNTAGDVTGLGSGATDVCAGQDHSCARLADGQVRCWGLNSSGQLGDNSTTSRTTAVAMQEIGPDRSVERLAAGNQASEAPAYDGAGRYVVFQSGASDLSGGDSNAAIDVFRLDTQTQSIERISVDDAENQISGPSFEPSLSANGQLAVFVAPASAAPKLAGESSKAAAKRRKALDFLVLLRNMQTGSTRNIGTALPSGTGTHPTIAPSGDAVVFTGSAAPGEGQIGQINVFHVPLSASGNERIPGPRSCVSCKSVTASGAESSTPANGESRNAHVSGDGNQVVWQTQATNTLASSPSPCTGSSSEVLARNMQTGVVQRVSLPSAATVGDCGTQGAQKPRIDWAGHQIVYESDQSLAAAAGGRAEVFVTDIRPNVQDTRWLSQTGAGTAANGPSHSPVISGDGRTAVFSSDATNLDSGSTDANGASDLHAQLIGRTSDPQRLSLGRDGAQANQASVRPALNYNGTQLAFDSSASNLVGNDTNALSDVFQRSLPANASLVFLNGFD